MAILGAESLHVVLLGDFNSDPFTDAWTLRRGPAVPGYTCCQASDLSTRKSEHDERIDLVWVRSGAGTAKLSWAKTQEPGIATRHRAASGRRITPASWPACSCPAEPAAAAPGWSFRDDRPCSDARPVCNSDRTGQ